MSSSATPRTGSAGNGRVETPPPGSRSSDEIRDDIVKQRGELSQSVDALRDRWSEATDIKGQIAKHKTELLVGAAVVGFAVGAVIAFRRRG